MKKATLSFLLFFLCLQLTVHSQVEELQGIKQTLDITMDELGNANLDVSMKLNAAQWDAFKRNTGNNTSMLKREMEKSLPKFFLSDFKYSEEQMDRSYTLHFKSAGLARITEDGLWEAQLDTKNPDVTRLSEKEFVISNDMVYGGTTVIKQTIKLHLPQSATDAKISKDSFGNSVITYSASQSLGFNWTLYAGIFLIAAGTGLYFRKKPSSITWSQLRSRLKRENSKPEKPVAEQTNP